MTFPELQLYGGTFVREGKLMGELLSAPGKFDGGLLSWGTFVQDSMESPKDLSLLKVDHFLWRYR